MKVKYVKLHWFNLNNYFKWFTFVFWIEIWFKVFKYEAFNESPFTKPVREFYFFNVSSDNCLQMVNVCKIIFIADTFTSIPFDTVPSFRLTEASFYCWNN